MAVAQGELDRLWDFSDAQSSENRLRMAASHTDDDAERDEYLTQVARALGLQGHFAEAAALLDSLPQESAGALGVRVPLERGRLLNSQGRQGDAIPLFRKAVRVATDNEQTFLLVDALHMLAIAEPQNAGAWASSAMQVAEQADPRTQRWMVSLHNNLGWDFVDSGRLDVAREEFEAAQEWADRVGTPQQRQWAREALAELENAERSAEQQDLDQDDD